MLGCCSTYLKLIKLDEFSLVTSRSFGMSDRSCLIACAISETVFSLIEVSHCLTSDGVKIGASADNKLSSGQVSASFCGES